jgi:prepilin-type N-terminal cleavage/methylation domain-containing protein
MRNKHFNITLRGVTLLELLAVLLIIGILSTMATGVYIGESRRARLAATKDLIRQLELAITRYEIDLGSLPPSGSGDLSTPAARNNGSGLLHAALVHSMSGNSTVPASPLWRGPYITFQVEQLAPASETEFQAGRINILDAYGNALSYINKNDYNAASSSFNGGTQIFTGSGVPAGTNPNLPAPNPYAGLGETNYNQQTYQIISRGENGVTPAAPFAGTDYDDVTNFGY